MAATVSDNGTVFTSMAILKWGQDTTIDLHDIVYRMPQQNILAKCFNSKRRDSVDYAQKK